MNRRLVLAYGVMPSTWTAWVVAVVLCLALDASNIARVSVMVSGGVVALGVTVAALRFWPVRERPARRIDGYPMLRYERPPVTAPSTLYEGAASVRRPPPPAWRSADTAVGLRVGTDGLPVARPTSVAVAEGATEPQGQPDGLGASSVLFDGYAAGTGPDSAAPAPPDDHLRGFAGGALDRERTEGDDRG